jgi:uncharacterized protein (TIGR02001 family)
VKTALRPPRLRIESAPRWIAAALALASAGLACAQDPVSNVSGYFTLASGYWKHGLAQNDGAALQLGVDYQHYSGFFTHARVTNVAYPQNVPGQTRDIETSAYVGYHDRRDRWSWTASVGRYVYPDAAVYNYDEISLGFGFRDRVFYSASYNDEYYAGSSSALNQEVSVVFPLRGDLELGGALGYFDVADAGPEITHWNVGVSKLFRRMALDLRYYDPDADHYVLSLSYALRGSPGGTSR